jgi:hypothetical protein
METPSVWTGAKEGLRDASTLVVLRRLRNCTHKAKAHTARLRCGPLPRWSRVAVELSKNSKSGERSGSVGRGSLGTTSPFTLVSA